MAPRPRNYKKEYANYQSKPQQKVNRAARNQARRTVKKAGVNTAGKDIAHKNGNPRDNRRGNLTLQRPSQNRSFARTKTAKDKARKKSYYARHDAQGKPTTKLSAKYWSHKVKW